KGNLRIFPRFSCVVHKSMLRRDLRLGKKVQDFGRPAARTLGSGDKVAGWGKVLDRAEQLAGASSRPGDGALERATSPASKPDRPKGPGAGRRRIVDPERSCAIWGHAGRGGRPSGASRRAPGIKRGAT